MVTCLRGRGAVTKLAAYFRTVAGVTGRMAGLMWHLFPSHGQPDVPPVVSARHSGGGLMEKDYLQLVLDGGEGAV